MQTLEELMYKQLTLLLTLIFRHPLSLLYIELAEVEDLDEREPLSLSSQRMMFT